MFDGDNDGSSGMLPWVCVFCGLQRMIESVKMKEKKMKLKLRMLETNEKKMKRKVRDKRKSDR